MTEDHVENDAQHADRVFRWPLTPRTGDSITNTPLYRGVLYP